MAFICQKRWRPADERCDAPPADARPLNVEPARRGPVDGPVGRLLVFPAPATTDGAGDGTTATTAATTRRERESDREGETRERACGAGDL